MARRTPQGSNRTIDPEADDRELNISSGGGDDTDDEQDEDDEDSEDEDRGDDVDDADSDDDEDEDDDADDEEDDDADDEDEQDDGDDEGEDEDDELDPEDLRDIAGTGTVPLARLNEVLDRVRQLEGQLAARGGAPAAGGGGGGEQPPDLKALQKERNAKLLEGDEDAAAELDAQIAQHIANSAAQAAVNAVTTQTRQERMNAAVAEVISLYPALNERKRKFSQDTVDEVSALRDVYIKRGDAADVALRKAAKRICERPGRSVDGDEGEGRQRRDPNRRTQAELSRAVRNARRTPPALSRNGSSGKPRDSAAGLSEEAIARMPESRFKAISAREKAEARGDFVDRKQRKTRR